jgi:hypothetical protein
MNSTSTVAGRAAGRTGTAAPRGAASQAARAAGRQILATAGNQVLKAAVDRAVSKVDQTAGRLDEFAAREPRPSRSRVAGTSPKSAAGSGGEPGRGSAVRAKVGASFSFVAQRAMVLLQLIQRLAQQLLDALARLVHRVRGKAAQEEPEEAPQEEPEQPTSSGRTPPGADSGKTGKRPRPPGDAAAGKTQPPRRPRPAPGAPAAPARRRVPGGQAGPDGVR